jgi:hypothetical protein
VAKAGKKSSPEKLPPEQVGEVRQAGARFGGAGNLQADPQRFHDVNLDGPPPPAARDWLREAAHRLVAAQPSPERVTDAGRVLEKQMAEAFLRREVDAAWDALSIKNFLTKENFWPSRRRRPK